MIRRSRMIMSCDHTDAEIFPTWAEALSFARHEGEIV